MTAPPIVPFESMSPADQRAHLDHLDRVARRVRAALRRLLGERPTPVFVAVIGGWPPRVGVEARRGNVVARLYVNLPLLLGRGREAEDRVAERLIERVVAQATGSKTQVPPAAVPGVPGYATATDFARKEHLGQPWAEHWVRFAADMTTLGLEVHECDGPAGWGGPAVTVPAERLAEVVRATAVKLDHHQVGANVMAHPAPVRR